MPITRAQHRRPPLPGPRARRAGARAGAHAGMDAARRKRPRRHAGRAVRLPDREPALPGQPRARGEPPQVPAPARRAARCRHARARPGRVQQQARRSRAARRCPRAPKCAPATSPFAPRRRSTCCRSRRAPSSSSRSRRAKPTTAYYKLLYQPPRRNPTPISRMYETRALDRRQSVELAGRDGRRRAVGGAARAAGRRARQRACTSWPAAP